MTTQSDYNGWKNRATWNCALWIGNDRSLYFAAVDFMKKYTGRQPYRMFIRDMGLTNDRTPDGIKWMSRLLDISALNGMMKEL